MFRSLTAKLLLLYTVLICVVVLVLGFLTFKSFDASFFVEEENQRLDLLVREIDSFAMNIGSDVLFLSRSSNLLKLIHADDEVGGNDEAGIESEENGDDALVDVQKDFFEFSNQNDWIYQLRYIDETGQEVVRVDSDGKNSSIIPKNELQNKSGRYYFDDTMKAKKGVVFVSPLDLNIEGGELENRGTASNPRYVSVIRYGTPVFNDEGDPKGIVIVNVYADQLLRLIRNQSIDSKGSVVLLNSDGYYLSHEDQGKEFGFMLDNDETIQLDYENIGDTILINEHDDYFMQGESIVFHRKIFPSGSDVLNSKSSNKSYSSSVGKAQGRNYYWILASLNTQSDIFARSVSLRNRYVSAGVISVAIAIIVTFFISRSIGGRIRRVKEVADEIARGNMDVEVDVEGEDEIAQLSESIDKMRVSLTALWDDYENRLKSEKIEPGVFPKKPDSGVRGF